MKQADMKTGRAVKRNEGSGFEFQRTFALRPLVTPVGLVSFVMTRKMLLGIRQRAESARTTPPPGSTLASPP